jgi:hypothetical protein
MAYSFGCYPTPCRLNGNYPAKPNMTIAWTGNLKHDWQLLCSLWHQTPYVLQSEVGSLWEMPLQHKVCIEFADRYPDSKLFLIDQLQDPDPRIAAYAFKCLARVTDIQRPEIPNDVFVRGEKIATVLHSFTDETTIGDFIRGYFDAYSSQDDLLKEQERSISWQENELDAYKRQSESESGENAG